MIRPVIGVHGNCVAECLVDVLSGMPSITEHFEIGGTTLYRPYMSDETLSRCVLLICQDRLRGTALPVPEVWDRVPAGCALMRLPHVTLSSPWPLTCVDPRNVHPLGRYSRSQTDFIALEVMRTVADPTARRAAYLSVDARSRVDLSRYHEVQAEHLAHAERACHVQVAAHILASFRKQRLFFVAHHPSPDLMLYIVAQIIAHPLFAPVRRASVATLLDEASAFLDAKRPFQGEEVPIHPQVAEFFQLEWCPPDLSYELDGRHFTFEEWLDYYMAEPLPLV